MINHSQIDGRMAVSEQEFEFCGACIHFVSEVWVNKEAMFAARGSQVIDPAHDSSAIQTFFLVVISWRVLIKANQIEPIRNKSGYKRSKEAATRRRNINKV